MWKKLKELYERKNVKNKAFLIWKLVNMKYIEGKSMPEHLSIFQETDENYVNLVCDDSTWIMNSSGSCHVTPRREFFTSYTAENFDKIKLGDKGVCDIGYCTSFGSEKCKITKGALIVAKEDNSLTTLYQLQAKLCKEETGTLMATRGQGRSPIRRDYESNPSMDNHAELMVGMTNLANTIQAGTAMATHALRQTRQSVGGENEEGAEDVEADNWFKAVEGALQTQQVPSNQFVEYAAYQLMGEAQQWWQGERRLLHLQEVDITRALFQEAFYKKYLHESLREAKELELL
ncbi:uncharacterized protein LOC110272010 [Arachis ipaensis]|uniref:uncharacterized protein LOC110272010 n=1 Tax=Arachis ipaensis TaxID=130454 RepID=UPI000A2B4EF2|nr:uncharacterized protein LOC110272010 [Arachis ipaensis]